MKHAIIITDKDGAKATIIYQYLTAVALHVCRVVWTRTNMKNRCELELATEDEARAAYDKINEGLEAWLGRNDPPVMMPLISHSLDFADYRYEVMCATFRAHSTECNYGDVIEYDPSQSNLWQLYIDEGMIKRV